MKSRYAGLPTFVWMLLGLLAISAALLSLGQRDDHTHPATDSFGPSGASAFAELLRQNGYRVRIDQRPRPKIERNELAVAFDVVDRASLSSKKDESFQPALTRQLREGGKAILLTVPD